MPENTTYVGRPSKWGNLARGDQFQAAASYVLHLEDRPDLVKKARAELEGKNLACWCPLDSPCHGNVLLLVANGITLETVSADLKLLWETRFIEVNNESHHVVPALGHPGCAGNQKH